MDTQVGIVGAGPAGLALGLMLQSHGIDSLILEVRDRDYVEQRIRAGVLEQNTVNLLRNLGVGERLAREGLEHHGIYLRRQGDSHYIPMTELTGRAITIYGQQEVVKDLIKARLEREAPLLFEVEGLAVHGIDTDRPAVTYTHEGREHELRCDFIAGCDGFHGVCRRSIPSGVLTELDYTYPFAWLGILVEAKPATDELIYAWHEHGFALYSMRSPKLSRLYLQVPEAEELAAWPDDRIWPELELRLGKVNEGPIVERLITPMRSFVASPMQHGRLILCGDAAHIVPPTGAKGLNLAVNDARLLAAALADHYDSGDDARLESYSSDALRRVWRAQDFSNYMTQLLHNLGGGAFEQGLQLSRLDYIIRSDAAARSLAENYVGLPATPDF
ncbi:MAG: 4-hydroxybenzoate 3-monooxygenase [Actinomycetota bacterium]|nr:4-hydroxybenzoate 3-monooxygenase [Actinomycetota bacterium]